jgi:hypothetical protein
MSIAVEHGRFQLTANRKRSPTIWTVIHIVNRLFYGGEPSGGKS